MALSMQEKWDPKCTSDSTWINDWVIFRSPYLAKNRCIILCITRADRHLDPAVPNDKPTLGLNKLHKNTEVCKKQPKQNFIPILQYSTIGSWIFSVWTKKNTETFFNLSSFVFQRRKKSWLSSAGWLVFDRSHGLQIQTYLLSSNQTSLSPPPTSNCDLESKLDHFL